MSRERRSLAVFNFTERGKKTALRLRERMGQSGRFTFTLYDCRFCMEPVGKVVERIFGETDVLIFIGAAGIAVRLIAPFIKDKRTDPAVLVIDERGTYVIPVLSGHIGGANTLAGKAAEVLGAVPVITTATDLNRAFAVDVFASENEMAIEDMRLAKEMSAAVLRGEKIGFFSDFAVDGCMPREMTPGIWQNMNLYITQREGGEPSSFSGEKPESANLLRLIPKTAVLGMGCRRGASGEAVAAAAMHVLEKAGISRLAVSALATVDRKKEEPAFLEFVKEWKLDFCPYPAEMLEQVPGDFAQSEFVKKTVGVGNVCERAAVLAAAQKLPDKDPSFVYLAAGKTAVGAVTAALAVPETGKEEKIQWKKKDFI